MKQEPTFGLENLGCSCYINACIQILFATDELNQLLKISLDKDSSSTPEKHLILEWIELWNELSQIDPHTPVVVSPKRFIHNLHQIAKQKNRPEFRSHEQNDFAEFLYFMVDSFHTGIAKPVNLKIRGKKKTRQDAIAQTCYDYLKNLYTREFSPIYENFFGLTVSEIFYAKQEKSILSTTPEHFFIMDLEIPASSSSDSVNLYTCIDRYVGDELLTGSNAWHNEKTGTKETVIKRLSFWHVPKIFIICLKRFHGDALKNNTLVDFPLTDLDLTKYVCGYAAHTYKYDLYATCNHYGTGSYGHYTANVCKNGEWFCFNDQQVFKIEDTAEFIMQNAYCLFYRRIEEVTKA